MSTASDDFELLRQYVETGSEPAFAELVRRHTDMVYSAAVRQVGRGGAADEVVQAVFILLMRKAASLRPGTVIGAWLFKATRYTSMNALRAQTRRRRYEQEAGQMDAERKQARAAGWPVVEPMLDEAIAGLNAADRTAVVLRFLERRSLAEVGQALGVSENAAHMRVQRAMEKMRTFFQRRGIALTATALGVTMTARATEAAPPTLSSQLSVATLRMIEESAGHGVSTLAGSTSRQMLFEQVRSVAVLCAAVGIVIGGAVCVLPKADLSWPTVREPAAVQDDGVRTNAAPIAKPARPA